MRATFAIPERARIGFIGPSGAGKSTLLNAIAGFVPLAAGSIRWKGNDISALSPAERPVSIVFQDNNLFPHLSVSDNVGLGINPKLKLTPDQRKATLAALERVGLSDKGKRMPGSLSGGQHSRVALARILVQQRPLILLDEPFAALGPAQRKDMLHEVASVQDALGATVLMISHDPGDIRAFATHASFVDEGEAAAPVPTKDLFAAPPEGLAEYLGQKETRP